VGPAARHPDSSRCQGLQTSDGSGVGARALDPESRRWLKTLDEGSPSRDEALAELHQLLLRAAHAELGRRRGRHPLAGPELEDLAHQAAHDAMLGIVNKLGQFRGESRFTTWAYKFVILEVSSKLGRHFWQRPTVRLEGAEWDRLPDRFGVSPHDHAAQAELVTALRRAVSDELTEHQRRVFVALVVDGVPLEALAIELGSNRNAIYKTMFDARRKLRAALVTNGHMEVTPS
jgi:RNA polymerase sigma-70 factor (ECF subfamily)